MTPIFVVVGPPAVGKSTTSRALAARFAKSLHIPVDNIREMVVSGLRLPSADWSDELIQQLSLARASVSHMALTYREAGFAVVIDDFVDPNHRSDYRTLFNEPEVHLVLLYPSQNEAHQRNLRRSGNTPARAYIDDGIRTVYAQLDAVLPQLKQEGWHVLDTSLLSVEDTVMAILRLSTT
ncbi:MAG: AAA family ATPase [Chloroflexi bacterium]|nr:AAA family ATPase [Chloroflexota bacterium]